MLLNITIASFMMLGTTVLHVAGIYFVVYLLKDHLSHWRHRHPLIRARKIGGIALLMFFLSIVEVVAWAGVYLLVGALEETEKALYFSMVTFTTLGYGDILINQKWRLLAAFEAANGIILFGLTTAVIVAAVQRVYFSDSAH